MRSVIPAVLLLALPAAATLAGEVRIVNEGGIRDQWTLAEGTRLAAPGYPADLVERGDNVCVALGYAIKPDGTTSDFSVVKRWSDAGDAQPDEYWDAFAQAGAAAVSQWRFASRPEVQDPQPTYTVATLQFMGGGKPMEGAVLRGHCKVDNLAAVLRRNQRVTPQNSQVRSDLERAERQSQSSGAMIGNPVANRREGEGNRP